MRTFGTLTLQPALERPDLLGDPVRKALASWEHAGEVGVAEIDPDLADTAAMTEAYDVPLESSANCVVVMGRRGGEERTAACVVRADTRADVNNAVRRTLDVRKCSFLEHERAVAETGMEYGGITPIGLPAHWRLFIDASVADIDNTIIGSGIRGSKLFVTGRLLCLLPEAELITDLAR
jgi:prolyl-tRNA editing enzyme YbaK/EbsC (Cys-tRNA(Pro) deacylase)